MRLNEIQAGFRDLMLGEYKALDTPPENFTAQFAANDIKISDRLKVYRSNIIGNITGALRTKFPLIDKLVGAEFFDFMARHYILENPPGGGYLGTYGHDFDQFLKNFEPVKNLPYLTDTARFEIMMDAAYYAEDDDFLAPGQMALIEPGHLFNLNLNLRSAARLIASPYPLDRIRDYCLQGDRHATLDLDTGPVWLLITRPALNVEILSLTEAEHTFLTSLQTGQTLGQSLEATLHHHPSFAIHPVLQRHVAGRLFKHLILNL